MNNRFFKLVCSAAAVIAMSSQAFAQSSKSMSKDNCNTPSPWQQGIDEFPSMPAAAPNPMAAIMTKGWDVFFDMSFIYWHADQEYMDLGKTDTTVGNPSTPSTTVAFTDYTYKPGFKAGFGFGTGYDGWVGTLDYTWLHQTVTTSIGAPPADTVATAAWTNNDWFTTATAGVPNHLQTTAISGKWKLNMDMLDASVSRPYYQGRDLTILPYAGLRGLWLRQANQIQMQYGAGTTPSAVTENTSHSWSVGPNMGVNANWLVGCGFRFEGFGGGSVLYTRYTRVAHDEHNATPVAGAVSNGAITNYNALRATLDAGLGLGWGSYFSNLGYHFDLLARYDFMVAFQQNMMRYNARLISGSSVGTNPIGDLHLHGLTVTARFDF
jgi:hypothetical protein